MELTRKKGLSGQSSNLFLDLCLRFFDNVNLVWNRPNAWHPLMENKGEREGGENLLRAQVEEGLEELNGFIHFDVLQ
jgi:hypothetical protein